jgi:hypothetical protein
MQDLSGVADRVQVEPGRTLQPSETTGMVDGRPFRMKFKTAPLIRDGDRVVLVGDTKGGVLDALAYCNQSNGAQGNRQLSELIAVGLWLIFAGLGLLLLLIGIFIIPVGFVVLWQASRVHQAQKWARAVAARKEPSAR